MRLLRLGSEDVKKLVSQLEKEVETIRHDGLKMCWYMRGGISYTDIMNLSNNERNHISKIIEENLETTKNTKMPFF